MPGQFVQTAQRNRGKEELRIALTTEIFMTIPMNAFGAPMIAPPIGASNPYTQPVAPTCSIIKPAEPVYSKLHDPARNNYTALAIDQAMSRDLVKPVLPMLPPERPTNWLKHIEPFDASPKTKTFPNFNLYK